MMASTVPVSSYTSQGFMNGGPPQLSMQPQPIVSNANMGVTSTGPNLWNMQMKMAMGDSAYQEPNKLPVCENQPPKNSSVHLRNVMLEKCSELDFCCNINVTQ